MCCYCEYRHICEDIWIAFLYFICSIVVSAVFAVIPSAFYYNIIFGTYEKYITCWPILSFCNNINGTIYVDNKKENSFNNIYNNLFIICFSIASIICFICYICGCHYSDEYWEKERRLKKERKLIKEKEKRLINEKIKLKVMNLDLEKGENIYEDILIHF